MLLAWTTLGKMPPGSLFRTGDGVIGVLPLETGATKPEYCATVCLSGGVFTPGSYMVLLESTPAQPISLEAMERENAEMARCVHDRREEAGPWIERGAAMEREVIARRLWAESDGYRQQAVDATDNPVAREWWNAVAEVFASLTAEVRRRGDILPPLPPDRMAQRIRELEAENARLTNNLAVAGLLSEAEC